MTKLGSFDYVHGLAVDSQGAVYVAGDTASSDFPVKNAYQAKYGGVDDAFVARFNPTLSSLEFSTFLGGRDIDEAAALALDGAGNVIVAGTTKSLDFPVANALQPSSGGSTDIFLTKLNRDGTALLYSTYLGGSGADGSTEGVALAVDAAGNVYLTGDTRSANNFPRVLATQLSLRGVSDAFVVKISANGSLILFSTLIGGTGAEGGRAIAVGGAKIVVTGNTTSPNFPVVNALQPQSGQSDMVNSDLFIAVWDDSPVRRRAAKH